MIHKLALIGLHIGLRVTAQLTVYETELSPKTVGRQPLADIWLRSTQPLFQLNQPPLLLRLEPAGSIQLTQDVKSLP